MILSKNLNVVGSLRSFLGLKCYQIVFPNLTMVKRLHMSHKPSRLSNLCGRYKVFRKNSNKSKDFQDKLKWRKRV